MIVLYYYTLITQYSICFGRAPASNGLKTFEKAIAQPFLKSYWPLKAPLHYIYHTYRTLCKSVDVRWVGVVNNTGPAHLWSDKQNKKKNSLSTGLTLYKCCSLETSWQHRPRSSSKKNNMFWYKGEGFRRTLRTTVLWTVTGQPQMCLFVGNHSAITTQL